MRCARNIHPGPVRETFFQFIRDALEKFRTSFAVRNAKLVIEGLRKAGLPE
jgi:hypothetical protein